VRHVVMFSGGVGSWAAAKRVAATHGTDDLTLLFTDTRIEDEDNYRFLGEGAANVGGELVMLTEGRTPWEIFRDERILTHRFDPCSKILKRQQADRWLADNCDPAGTVVYVGIDWSEVHRFDRLRDRRAADGWRYEAPMCEAPYMDKPAMLAWLRSEGIEPPRLYALGFAHANCGGFCIKAGQGHFANLLRTMPARYAHHEAQEEALRAELGEGAGILRDRTGDESRTVTLREFRERIEAGYQPDLFDIGGCGCFIDTDQKEAA
jgi:hypothetical protein